MSGFQRHGQDLSRYNHMSTEELEEILRADFALPDEEESDMEKILYITEVIARRRAGQPTGRYANADEAWESFVENYLPTEEQTFFRQEIESVGEPETSVKRAKSRRWRTVLTWAASVVVVIMLVAAAGTVTASALGFNFWAWLTAWTQELFGIQNPNNAFLYKQEISEQLTELYSLMKEYGFPDNLLPTYLQEGYETDTVEYDSNAAFIKLLCFLSKNDDSIILDYTMYLSNQVTEEAQKDEDNPEAYERGGVTHYIMTNDETYYAVWTVDNVKCGIYGASSYDELTLMINSIYGGNS